MSTRCNIEFYDESTSEYSEPAARLYKHSDGYPSGILPLLSYLQKILGQRIPMYGPRLNDPEWIAAEFISQFRVISNAPKKRDSEYEYEGEGIFGDNLWRHRGNIYVSQSIHQDIEFLYRVICKAEGWEIHIFKPIQGEGNSFNIVSFEEVTEKYSKTGKEKKSSKAVNT